MGRTRIALAAIVAICTILTFSGLLYESRGDAISKDRTSSALQRLTNVFLPLVGLVIGYLFGSAGSQEAPKGLRRARSIFAVTIVAAWCIAPVILYFTMGIENALELLTKMEPWGEFIVLNVLGFYFSHK